MNLKPGIPTATSFLLLVYAVMPVAVLAAEPTLGQAFLQKYCVDCHSGEKPAALLDFARLEPVAEGNDSRAWEKVFDQVTAGTMPPREAQQPPAAERKQALAWLEEALTAADLAARAHDGRVVMRRLNRVQIENTLRDLLDLPYLSIQEMLPEDGTAGGFNTVGEALEVSAVHVRRYMEVAQHALDEAIVHSAQPEKVQRRLLFQNERRLTGPPFYPILALENESIIFGRETGIFKANLTQFGAPYPGEYRIRISASGYQTDERLPLVVVAGQGVKRSFLTDTHLLGYYDTAPDKPEVIELVGRLEQEDHIRVYPPTLRKARFPRENSDEAKKAFPGSGLAIQWVDVEGPLFAQWPPASHQRLFAGVPLVAPPEPETIAIDPRRNGKPDRPRKNDKPPRVNLRRLMMAGPAPLVLQSEAPEADAQRLLEDFLPRAFRRPATSAEVELYHGLFRDWLAQGSSFEEAMRVAYTAVLSSPEFLYLREAPGALNDHALASRLSYFLWNSLPDAELLSLAEEGKLHESVMLHAQVERMLNDPRSGRFVSDFVAQWLDLDEIDATTPDPSLYPEFDALLQHSMVQETEHFVHELIAKDLSVRNVVDSEFAFLNGRLASHYGIDGVTGVNLRRVELPAGSPRGGLLTQASVLKVTANGTTTSPVTRGVWLLENILGQPADPPPANVPALEPDIRGATSIREQLARHRELEACAVCHRQIDPLGFGLESFDVIGGFRQRYRSLETGDPVEPPAERLFAINYLHGLPVDAGDKLASGESFSNVQELKELLADERQLAECLAKKLLTYATGATPGFADRAVVADIVRRASEKNYGFRSLIQAVVASEAFTNK